MTVSFAAGVLITLLVPALGRAREAYRLSRCELNLKQFGLVFKMYANDHRGRYPYLSRVPGRFFPAWDEDAYSQALGHKNIDYPDLLTCPSNLTVPLGGDDTTSRSRRASAWDDRSYIYFGYVITHEEEGFAFLEAYERKVTEAIDAGNLALDERSGEWLLPESFWGRTLYVGDKRGNENGDYLLQLDESRHQFDHYAPDYDPFSVKVRYCSKSIVMFDRPGTTAFDFNHTADGINVAFMDGHVEFKMYPSKGFNFSPRFFEKFMETEARIEKLYADFVDAQGK